MQKYYYTIQFIKEEKSNNYSNVKAIIYLHTKNGMEAVGTTYYNTNSMKGHDSEIYSYLLKNGFKITKYKQNKLSLAYQEYCMKDKYYSYVLEQEKIISIKQLY